MYMKTLHFLLFSLAAGLLSAQPFGSYNMNLISRIDPDTNSPQGGNRYSGCWGWHQESRNKEYVISGGRNGTWFIDVTNPATPSVSAYVPGVSKNCTWREVKTYSHYCYIVSDVCKPNAFQIVDMQYLPDSVRIVHSDTTLFTHGHTAWIDQDKLYVASTNFGVDGYSPMTIWSLQDPENPQLIRKIQQDDPNVAEIHDMYVRNDTIYASAGWQGLRLYKLQGDSLEHLGSYSGYSNGSYNHSSFLTENGKYLLFCDEVPGEQPMRLVDVSNFENIQPVQSWKPHPKTTPHNPYIVGNDWAFVSCYQDGLFLYDLRNAPSIGLAGWFDTHHQGGFNVNNYGNNEYQGNWGAYPYLPSGVIVAQDMQNGIFLLDVSAAYVNPLGLNKNSPQMLRYYPNPAYDKLEITAAGSEKGLVTISDMTGRKVLEKNIDTKATLDISALPAGTYLIRHTGDNSSTSGRLLIIR